MIEKQYKLSYSLSDYTKLDSMDDLDLIRLMSKSGPCLQSVGVNLIPKIIFRIGKMLNKRTFISVLLPWIEQLTQILMNQ